MKSVSVDPYFGRHSLLSRTFGDIFSSSDEEDGTILVCLDILL